LVIRALWPELYRFDLVGRIHHRTICIVQVNKICQQGTNLPPKQALQLVQPSFAKRYLMKAMLAQA
jgi:hypothetical protein